MPPGRGEGAPDASGPRPAIHLPPRKALQDRSARRKPATVPSRAVTAGGIRPSNGGSGPRGHADERRLPRDGSPPESGYQRWPAARDPQTPTMPETQRPPGFGHRGRGPQGACLRRRCTRASGVTHAGPRALQGTPSAGRIAGRSMGPAPRWETAPAPDGGPAARTLNPPGAGRQPVSHGSSSWVGLGVGTECRPCLPIYSPTTVGWESCVQTFTCGKVFSGGGFYYGVVRACHQNWATFSYRIYP